jgi:large subunit ribosomal protein L17
MRKRIQGRTLSRNATQRRALKRTMLVSLINFGSIKTTLAKAKELRPFAERMVTNAKKVNEADKNTLTLVTRQLKKDLPLDAVKKLIELARVYQKRTGGYLRIVKLSPRKSDMAKLAIIEWVGQKKNSDKESVGAKEKKIIKKNDKKKKEAKIVSK